MSKMRPLHRFMIGASMLHCAAAALVFGIALIRGDDYTRWLTLAWAFTIAIPLFWGAIDYTYKRHDDRDQPKPF